MRGAALHLCRDGGRSPRGHAGALDTEVRRRHFSSTARGREQNGATRVVAWRVNGDAAKDAAVRRSSHAPSRHPRVAEELNSLQRHRRGMGAQSCCELNCSVLQEAAGPAMRLYRSESSRDRRGGRQSEDGKGRMMTRSVLALREPSQLGRVQLIRRPASAPDPTGRQS